MSADSRGHNPPSEEQYQYAVDLGLPVDPSMAGWEVSRMITAEVKRRGREVLQQTQLKVEDVVDHPRHGRCRIERIGEKTLKVSLRSLHTGECKVVNARSLEGLEPVKDED